MKKTYYVKKNFLKDCVFILAVGKETLIYSHNRAGEIWKHHHPVYT
jgi:hypothetical protein